jgi:hypothetical protein
MTTVTVEPAVIVASIIYVGLAILVAVKAHHAVQRVLNQRAAWYHLERIAKIAYEISNDDEAPRIVVKIVNAVADRVFDEEFYNEIKSMPILENPADSFSVQIAREYGPYYGNIIAAIVRSLAFALMYRDRTEGVKFRRWYRSIRRGNTANAQYTTEEELRPITQRIDNNMGSVPLHGFALQR